MSDWNDYLSDGGTDGTGAVASDVPDVAPALDAAAVDLDDGANAASWADWNTATSEEYVADAQGEIAYANDAYASGWDELGDAAMDRAGASLDVAVDHAETADGYDTTADGYATAADQELTSAQEMLDTSSYDTAAYESSSGYETSSSYESSGDE